MRRKRHHRSRSRSRSRARTRRDEVMIVPTGRPAAPRTLSQFRREVVALLAVGHQVPTSTGLRLIKKWDRYIKARWRQGKPPCAVSDHLWKFERERLVRPRPATSRDLRLPRGPSRKRRATRRLARDPGDIYESKRGDRWEVVSEDDRKAFVRRVGHRQTGLLPWSKTTLKSMKEIKKAGGQQSLFSGLLGGPVAPDPDRRRRRKRTRMVSKLTRKQTILFKAKVRLLLREGYNQKQALAIAYSYARRSHKKRTRR